MSGLRAPVSADEQRFRDAEWEALPRWRRGEVVPARITMLLDARGLYGPNVDLACGAIEPEVDEWEAGTRYPQFRQLVALARLVECTPMFFFTPMPARPTAIFICGRPRSRSQVVIPDDPIACYPPEVWQPVVAGYRDTLFDLEPTGALL